MFPNLLAAIGEGVYLLGAERNPNVVKMTSYAPSLQNLNWDDWDPDLLQFTANHDETTMSASWYLQSLLAHYRGTETLPVTTQEGDFNPLWWVATIDETANAIYFKVVNSGNSSIPLTINADVAISSANGTILVSLNPMMKKVDEADPHRLPPRSMRSIILTTRLKLHQLLLALYRRLRDNH